MYLFGSREATEPTALSTIWEPSAAPTSRDAGRGKRRSPSWAGQSSRASPCVARDVAQVTCQ
uniref:Uncharacterized protein n=1 Tax=Siphoviridae sp. ctnLs3 TaxID=2827937 RepID=A0A8S5TDU1_9CAUD|nr:MAG TPA: hypothetical protein [Siphoviridae sp. ctnLs3]